MIEAAADLCRRRKAAPDGHIPQGRAWTSAFSYTRPNTHPRARLYRAAIGLNVGP